MVKLSQYLFFGEVTHYFSKEGIFLTLSELINNITYGGTTHEST